MKINREMVTRAGLTLLNEEGLEQLTLRRLAVALDVQAATIYWHFKDKQALLDEMATTVLAEGAAELLPARRAANWTVWTTTYGHGLRRTLLRYRDGARMVAGTRLTNTVYLQATEHIGQRLGEAGFSVRAAVVLLSTVFNYTQSFVMEEQAVFPTPGERSPQYGLAERRERLDRVRFPFHHQATGVLFDRYDRRFREGLALIVRGAQPDRS